MREIKFRARWRDTGKVIPDFMEEYTIDVLNDTCFIVEEFTGLRDKNGKDIWEGDILSVPAEGTWPEYKYIVDFWHGSFVAKETGSSGLNNYPNNFNFRSSEVIGNIYEHSHLLKGESNEAK